MKNPITIILILLSVIILTSCGTPVDNTPRASIGPKDASILIEEFSDFQCPACSQVSPQLEQIVRKYSDKIRLEFYNYPIPYHQYAFKAAEAAECANDQGKFWEFGKLAFANNTNLTEDNLKKFAVNLKLDTTKFNQCLDSGTKKNRIKNDMAEGENRGIGYTPYIIVNKKVVKYTGATAFEEYLKGLMNQTNTANQSTANDTTDTKIDSQKK